MLGSELGRWKRFLLEIPLYLLGLLSLLAGLGAYQVRAVHFIQVGGLHDAPYLSSFHEPEPDRSKFPKPEVDYRWTRGRVGIDLFGIGRQDWVVRLRMQAYRPGDLSAPQAWLWCRGRRLLATTVGPSWQVYPVLVPAELLPEGDLHLVLESETFRPAGDARDLGVTVDWIEVYPAGGPFVEPSWGQVACLVAVTLSACLLLRRLGLSPFWTGLAGTAVALLLAYLLACHRLALTCFSGTLALLLAGALGLTAVVLPWLEGRFRSRSAAPLAASGRRPRPGPAGRGARLLWAILLVGFLLRLGGVLYPQFRASDLWMHVHNVQYDVLPGNLFFTELLPDINLPAPYPPGLYVAFLPLTVFSENLPLLMEIAGVALDTVAGVLLYLLAGRLTGRRDAALLAVLLQQAAPVTYLIFSWGNYTNMFSRVTLLGALSLLALGRWERGRQWIALVAAFGLVLLSHFADSLLFGAFVLGALGLGLLTAYGRRVAPAVLGALLLAGALVLALYYTAPVEWTALQGGLEAFLQRQSRPAGLVNPLPQFLEHVQTPLALLALPGLVLLAGHVRRWPLAVLGGALLAAFLFALGQAFFGFSSRYSLFLLPVLALGTGLVLAMLRRRGWAGRLAVGALLAGLVWNAVWVWGWTIGFGQR